MNPLRYFVIAGLAILLGGIILAPVVPSNLHDVVNTPHNSYEVWYTDDNPPPASDTNYVPAIQAQRAADALDNNNTPSTGNPNGYHNGYIGLGFLGPDFVGTPRRVFMYACTNCDSGNAPADLINMPSWIYNTASEAFIRLVAGHELFHHVQYAYITFNKWGSWGTMPVEGTARYMQDKVYSDLDANAGSITYLGQVNSFLGSPNQTIWNASYSSALFWNYLGEQLGTNHTEPAYGSDFVRTFWERAQADNASPNVVQAIREAIAHYNPSETLEAIFQDFTITNYTKRMDLSSLPNPARYRYVDENDAAATPYNNVALNWSGSVPPVRTASVSVQRWGARYLEADITGCSTQVAGFKATSNKDVGFALVAIKGTNSVEFIDKGSGLSFSRAVVQGVSPFTRLGIVITGKDQAATVNYTFDCAQPQLTIKEPKYPSPIAYVGDKADPDRFLLKVSVIGPPSLGESSIEGLSASDFTVYVGSEAAANLATVLNSSYVQGDYWMVVQPPTKAPADPVAYNVVVRLNPSLVTANEAAVRYESKVVDEILVIDRSGSMLAPAGSPKITAAKQAGLLYVDSTRDTDKIGVASFASTGSLDAYMRLAGNPGVRDTMKLAIGGLVAGGSTSIGDGLQKANDDFLVHGRPVPPTERWIVLMSDGMQNTAPYWAAVRPTILANHIKVISIALGPLTDQPLLQSIATDTGGYYYYVDLPPGTADLSASPTFPIFLGDAYALSAEKTQNHERLWEHWGSLGAGGSDVLNISIDEDEVEDGLFSVYWNTGANASVAVYDPSGTLLQDGVDGVQILTDSSHVTIRSPRIIPGTWQMKLSTESGIDTYLASLSGMVRHGAHLSVYLGAYGVPGGSLNVNQVLPGQPMPIYASLTDIKGPILGARVSAQVTHPDGSLITLLLVDDGTSGDQQAGDGIYSGLYTRTTVGSRTGQPDTVYSKNASYQVLVQASGKNNLGTAFSRVGKASFNIFDDPERNHDSDQDGMPDAYENLHPCLSVRTFDSDQDPDFDGLMSEDEYQAGTDPCRADTDNGGENDRSELNRGGNPFYAGDDQTGRQIDFQVVNKLSEHLSPQLPIQPNANLIRYAVDPNAASLRLLISDAPDGPFITRDEFDPVLNDGLYLDKGLTNGHTYYYMLQTVAKNGAVGAPSDVFSGTPMADPYQPIGSVTIEDGRPFVETIFVNLNMNVEETALTVRGAQALDVQDMLVSNLPDFSGASWIPYAPTLQWQLNPNSKGLATVYAKYRDAAGNESTPYYASVVVTGPGSLGGLHATTAILNPPPTVTPVAGVVMVVTNSGLYGPAVSLPNGSVTLSGLEPGQYDVLIQYPGYIPQTIHNVSVSGGATTELGSVVLEPFKMTYLPAVHR